MAAFALRARRARLDETSEPNVIPFIDVLLVLLVIFMVTAPTPTTDLRLDLPPPAPRAAALIPPTIVDVQSTGDGGYALMVSGMPTTLEAVGDDALAHLLSNNPELVRQDVLFDARIHIRSDMAVRYRDVVAVVEQLQDFGYEKVTVLAQRAD
ncbi:MAG: biopolymer transporter ExbD [Hyphomonadaceae bacterium]|nr:biopolymer transporter ExbD [Hyphomonadaceae bacterium]